MVVTSYVDPVRLRQENFYDEAEASRFEWLTGHPVIQCAERTLLGRLEGLDGVPSILEVGCGEGANLATLQSTGRRFRYTGFDCFPAKVAFCRSKHKGAKFLLADARRSFPFQNASYDRVLIRDVLHHLAVPDRAHVLHESMRVLRPGGRLWIVEGNARNLLGLAFALLFPHERCMLETRVPRLQRFVAETLSGHAIDETMGEPSNLFRLLCHYQFGLPAVGRTHLMTRLLQLWDRMSRALRPRRRWAYSIIEVRKNAG